jgi:hypothetical protein
MIVDGSKIKAGDTLQNPFTGKSGKVTELTGYGFYIRFDGARRDTLVRYPANLDLIDRETWTAEPFTRGKPVAEAGEVTDVTKMDKRDCAGILAAAEMLTDKNPAHTRQFWFDHFMTNSRACLRARVTLLRNAAPADAS